MRMRWIKPEFYSDPWFVRRSPLTRLLYQGLWCFADDAGRFVADVALIHGQLLPFDPRKAVEKAMRELEEAERIITYTVGGLKYGLVPMFAIHQRIDKPQRSVVPVPPLDVREKVDAKLKNHPRWDGRFDQNLRRMLYEDSSNRARIGVEDSANTLASHARARLDQGTKGPEDQGTEGGSPLAMAHRQWMEIHPRCREVSVEKFAEIVRTNPRAKLSVIFERLRQEVNGMEWPWRDKNAAQVLRNRVLYGEIDAQRERDALAGVNGKVSGAIKNAPPSAEELRDRANGGCGKKGGEA